MPSFHKRDIAQQMNIFHLRGESIGILQPLSLCGALIFSTFVTCGFTLGYKTKKIPKLSDCMGIWGRRGEGRVHSWRNAYLW